MLIFESNVRRILVNTPCGGAGCKSPRHRLTSGGKKHVPPVAGDFQTDRGR